MAAMARSMCWCAAARLRTSGCSGPVVRVLRSPRQKGCSHDSTARPAAARVPAGHCRAGVCADGSGTDTRSGQVAPAAALRPRRQDLDRARDDAIGGRADRARSRARCGGGAARDLPRGWPDGAEGAARDARCGGPAPAAGTGRSRNPAVRRSRGYRLAPGAPPADGVSRVGLWLRAALLGCDRGVPPADHGLAAGSAGCTDAGSAHPSGLRLGPGPSLRPGQHRRISRVILAAEPACAGPGLSVGLRGATCRHGRGAFSLSHRSTRASASCR